MFQACTVRTVQRETNGQNQTRTQNPVFPTPKRASKRCPRCPEVTPTSSHPKSPPVTGPPALTSAARAKRSDSSACTGRPRLSDATATPADPSLRDLFPTWFPNRRPFPPYGAPPKRRQRAQQAGNVKRSHHRLETSFARLAAAFFALPHLRVNHLPPLPSLSRI